MDSAKITKRDRFIIFSRECRAAIHEIPHSTADAIPRLLPSQRIFSAVNNKQAVQ